MTPKSSEPPKASNGAARTPKASGEGAKTEVDSATVAKLVHDLRGPVSRVKAVSELLREELQDALPDSSLSEQAQEWLTMIDRAVVRIDSLLQDLMDSTQPAAPASPTKSNGARSD